MLPQQSKKASRQSKIFVNSKAQTLNCSRANVFADTIALCSSDRYQFRMFDEREKYRHRIKVSLIFFASTFSVERATL
jgi:hypothetical protein